MPESCTRGATSPSSNADREFFPAHQGISGGASYKLGDLKLSTGILYGSGLRSDFIAADGTDIPNGGHVPGYVQVNLALNHHLILPQAGPLDLRFDVINVGDEKYEIRDGTGVGAGAPQFGPRRGFFAGVTKSF
jgi:outer membrane receptor protein involved in Fe transport